MSAPRFIATRRWMLDDQVRRYVLDRTVSFTAADVASSVFSVWPPSEQQLKEINEAIGRLMEAGDVCFAPPGVRTLEKLVGLEDA